MTWLDAPVFEKRTTQAFSRGILTVENHAKVDYLTCTIERPRVSRAAISPSSSNQNGMPIVITARLVIGKLGAGETRSDAADAFFAKARRRQLAVAQA